MITARMRRSLLLAGVATPIIYFATVIFSSLFYPGYSHFRQYASELGSASAPIPALFNAGIVIVGVTGLAAGAGLFFALRRIGKGVTLAMLVALCVALFGVAMIMGGLFPMPDPRHGAYGLGTVVNAGPVLLAIALWKQPSLRGLSLYLAVTAVLVVALFAVMMGVGGFVTRANVGMFQRLYALCAFPWIGVASYVLWRREKRGEVDLRTDIPVRPPLGARRPPAP